MVRFLFKITRPLLVLTLVLAGAIVAAMLSGSALSGNWMAARTESGVRLIDVGRMMSVQALYGTPYGSRGGLSWSPDGRYLLFAGEHDGIAGFHLLDTRTGRTTHISGSSASDMTPQWSPVADVVAFTSSRDGNFEIYTLNISSGETRNLTNHTGDDRYPVWSPDGERIAFVASRDNRHDIYDLYVIDVNSQRVRQVTETQLIRSPPVWSPDGRLLAYRSEFTGSIEVVTQHGTPQFRIDDDHNYYYPGWSPNGMTLAFFADRTSPYPDIYLASDQGANFTRLTRSPGSELAPVWSPAGDAIAFLSSRLSRTDVYLISVDGGDMRRLTFSGDVAGPPLWQP